MRIYTVARAIIDIGTIERPSKSYEQGGALVPAVTGVNMVGFLTSRKGTSLVEILVVMVVLLVGIMTVVQMFPTGFGIVKAAESQTVATRLAQQELERWKNRTANLPDGILPIDESGNVLNDQLPGPPFEAFLTNSDGSWKQDNGRYVRGNALNIRQVYGETTPIPMASRFRTASGYNFGSRYALGFGPIDLQRDPNTNELLNLSIRSGDLRRRTGDSDYAPPYLRAGEYAIDYEIRDGEENPGQPVFHVAFPKDPAVGQRKYYISYSFYASETPGAEAELYSVPSQSVSRPGDTAVAGDDGDWIEVPVDLSGLSSQAEIQGLDRYSDTCARGFLENSSFYPDPSAGTWGSPYEFYIADSLLGIIAFNPAGHGLYEYTARGTRPIRARIDYTIYDLRIIREDRIIPQPSASTGSVRIKMGLRFILDAGDPIRQDDGAATDNPDEPTFEGIVSIGGNRKALSVLVIDMETGLRVNDPNVTRDAALSKLPLVEVDYGPGIITLPARAELMDSRGEVVASNVPVGGRHFRFYYRAEGDWSIQCTKAYTAYTRQYGSRRPTFREFRFDGTNRLFFANCEYMKSVVVDYTYVLNGVEKKVSGESYRIDLDPAVDGMCVVDLKLPENAYIPPGARITVIGASFTVRAIWRDGARWRHVDLDTYLTR